MTEDTIPPAMMLNALEQMLAQFGGDCEVYVGIDERCREAAI